MFHSGGRHQNCRTLSYEHEKTLSNRGTHINKGVSVRFQVLTAANMMFRAVFWVILPCKMVVDRRFRGAYCLNHGSKIILHGSITLKTTLNKGVSVQRPGLMWECFVQSVYYIIVTF
jgi:hypothetical protein